MCSKPCLPRSKPRLLRSKPYLDARAAQRALQIGNLDVARMKYAGGERRIHSGRLEYLGKMFRRAGAARGDQRHAARRAYGAQLRDVEAPAYAVARHAIEHDLARSAPLHFDDPVNRAARGIAAALDVAGELLHSITLVHGLAVDADHHALSPKALAQLVDQFRTRERR